MAEVSLDQILRNHPDRLAPATSRECAPRYWQAVKRGEMLAAETDVTIVGLARDSMPFVDFNLQRVRSLGERFRSYRVYVYENDSVDETPEALRAWAENDARVTVETTRHERPKLSHEKSKRRTHALAEYRDHCRQWARDHAPPAGIPHRVIVLDFDSWGGWSDDGVMAGFDALERTPDAAGMASVSMLEQAIPALSTGKLWIHYDAWAFRQGHWTEHAAEWFPYWMPPVGSDPVPCRSAFGGMCIYRPEAYFSGTYTGHDCEHVDFHRSVAEATGLRMYLNPAQRIVMAWVPTERETNNGGDGGNRVPPVSDHA